MAAVAGCLGRSEDTTETEDDWTPPNGTMSPEDVVPENATSEPGPASNDVVPENATNGESPGASPSDYPPSMENETEEGC